MDDKIVSCQALIDGKSKEVTDNNSNADSRDERVIAKIKSGEIVNKISKDINVKSTYYFATPKNGSLVQYVVYLETDIGDFVYVYEADEEMEYIFPSNVFFELKKMEREYWYNEAPVLINGYSGPPLGSLKDIERYNINSPSFDLEIKQKSSYSTEILIITSVGCLVLVAGAIAGFAMRKKKNNQSK